MAIKFQYNKTSLGELGKQLKMRVRNRKAYWENYLGCVIDGEQSSIRLPEDGEAVLELPVKAAEKYEKWLLLMGALTVLLLIWAVMAQILKMTTKKRILALMIQLFLIGAGILAVYWFYGVLFW